MKIQKVYTISYSPTRTSFKIATAVAEGIGTEVIPLDITHKIPGNISFEDNSIAIIAAPVYGGKIAPVAAERLKQIQVNGIPAVLIATYGNRDYERAVLQLDELAVSQGFKTIAAAAFIGEHSYSSEKNPIAMGRPDKEDLQTAHEFGRKICRKLEAAKAPEELRIDVSHMKKTKSPLLSKLQFIFFVLKLRHSQIPVPKAPDTDITLCKHCGACTKACPVNAIPAGNETWTDARLCTRCCACVKVCTFKARRYETPFAPALSTYFRERKEPSLLL